MTRRRVLAGGACAIAGLALPRRALAAGETRLRFFHTHTRERIEVAWPEGGTLDRDTLHRLDHFLRDHYDGTEHAIDPDLHLLLAALVAEVDRRDAELHVISAYRSPATNARLRRQSSGVARNSLHVHGMAIDIRLPGTATGTLRDAALDLKRGGVGYYPAPDFIHVDTGRVRRW